MLSRTNNKFKTYCTTTNSPYLDCCNALLSNGEFVRQLFNVVEIIILRVDCNTKYRLASILHNETPTSS